MHGLIVFHGTYGLGKIVEVAPGGVRFTVRFHGLGQDHIFDRDALKEKALRRELLPQGQACTNSDKRNCTVVDVPEPNPKGATIYTVYFEDSGLQEQVPETDLYPVVLDPDEVCEGSFVETDQNDLGIGKVKELDGEEVTVEYFDNPGVDPHEEKVSKNSLSLVKELSPQTRVYFVDAASERWKAGQVKKSVGDDYVVFVPGINEELSFKASDLHVRWDKPIDNPIDLLGAHFNGSPHYQSVRHEFIKSITEQRRASAGITCLLSSNVDLERHQFNVVSQVLKDPVQRYLLADEVGLGKTIEACAIIRQHILERPSDHRVLIAVPSHIEDQWREELRDRFFLEHYLDEGSVNIVDCTDADALEEYGEGLTLFVVDEAHHISALGFSKRKTEKRLWKIYQSLSGESKRLLLLSATPVLRNEAGFLAMLHLLDPDIYPLEDLEGFRTRVRERQAIAENFDLFLPGEDRVVLRQCLDELIEIFPGDERMDDLAGRLEPFLQVGADPDDPELRTLVEELRVHISETYRLHRRLIRHRRGGDLDGVVPGRHGAKAVYYKSPDQLEIEKRLSRWIQEAGIAKAQEGVGKFFLLLLEGLQANHQVLSALCEKKPRGENELRELGLISEEIDQAHRDPFFEEDGQYLKAVSDYLEEYTSGDSDRIAALKELLREITIDAKKPEKAVVFVGCKSVAEELYEELEDEFGEPFVERHQRTDTGSLVGIEDWKNFLTNEQCQVLVCDRDAEEGLNLQGGRGGSCWQIVHYDLPLSPNRIEQRIGRLDRFGVGTEVQSYVLLPEGSKCLAAWFRILDEGLGVFNRSVAVLQYLIEEKMELLGREILSKGHLAFEELLAELLDEEKGVEHEKRMIDEQDALDSVTAREVDEEDPEAPFNKLALLEGEEINDEAAWRPIEKATEGWVCEGLGFEKREEKRRADGIYRYKYLHRRTKISESEIKGRFDHTLDKLQWNPKTNLRITHPITFNRPLAHRHRVRLGRVGDSFIEAMKDYLNFSDLGISSGVWKYRPGFKGETRLVFRLDYLVETDLGRARELADREESVSRESLTFRADEVFAPRVYTLFVGEDKKELEEGETLVIAQQAYKDLPPGSGEDHYLYPERWQEIRQESGQARWKEFCAQIETAARKLLDKKYGYLEEARACVEKAQADLKIHADQMSSRFALKNKVSATLEKKQFDVEQKLNGLIYDGVSSPRVQLSSVGAIYISNEDPFE